MRALALLELVLLGYLTYLLIDLVIVFFTNGVVVMAIDLVTGGAKTIAIVCGLALIADIWRVKKRDRLIKKRRLSPDRVL